MSSIHCKRRMGGFDVKVSLKNRLISFSLGVFTIIFVLIATSRNAYGYVDPGSGLLALQAFASAMAAAGFFLRKRFRGLLGLKNSSAAQSSSASKTDSADAA